MKVAGLLTLSELAFTQFFYLKWMIFVYDVTIDVLCKQTKKN